MANVQAEGIFRITAENSQEEQLRNQLNSGIVPDGIDVHCLAGLIKAWFRELPTGILDPLSPDQVLQCRSEEDCSALVRLLPPTENALLDWAINLMADVVQHEHQNKMNSHNIAMVFAPNMTQMVDPLTALMHAVQVMNFLKTLITKTLREREDALIESSCSPPREPSDENGHQGPPLDPHLQHSNKENEEEGEHQFLAEDDHLGYLTATEGSNGHESCKTPVPSPFIEPKPQVNHPHECKPAPSSGQEKNQPLVKVIEPVIEKTKGVSNLSCINVQLERIEAWR